MGIILHIRRFQSHNYGSLLNENRERIPGSPSLQRWRPHSTTRTQSTRPRNQTGKRLEHRCHFRRKRRQTSACEIRLPIRRNLLAMEGVHELMPELTPEERQRIYQEEKARFETRVELEKGRITVGKVIGYGFLAIVGFLFLLFLIASFAMSMESPEDTARRE